MYSITIYTLELFSHATQLRTWYEWHLHGRKPGAGSTRRDREHHAANLSTRSNDVRASQPKHGGAVWGFLAYLRPNCLGRSGRGLVGVCAVARGVGYVVGSSKISLIRRTCLRENSTSPPTSLTYTCRDHQDHRELVASINFDRPLQQPLPTPTTPLRSLQAGKPTPYAQPYCLGSSSPQPTPRLATTGFHAPRRPRAIPVQARKAPITRFILPPSTTTFCTPRADPLVCWTRYFLRVSESSRARTTTA